MSLNRKMLRQMTKHTTSPAAQQEIAVKCIQEGRVIGRKEAYEQTFFHIMTMTLLALHDKFGFGHDRLTRLIDAMKIYALCLHDRSIELAELKQVLMDECGIDIDELSQQEIDEKEGVTWVKR